MHQQDDNKKRASGKKQIFTKELLGSILIVLSVATLFILFTGNTVFGTVGAFMQKFVYGATGSVLTIGLLLFMATSGVLLLLGKAFKFKFKTTLLSVALFALIVAFAHALTLQAIQIASTLPYGEFIKQTYQAGNNAFVQVTAGGAVVSLILYPFTRLLSYVGTYIFLAIAIVVVGYFIFQAKINSLFTLFASSKKTNKVKPPKKETKPKAEKPTISVVHPNVQQTIVQPVSMHKPMPMQPEGIVQEEENADILPNILGKEYANYNNISNSQKNYTASTKESAQKKPSFMNNGIFDADSYFNKRHLQNTDATTPTTASSQNTTQNSSGWYPYGEPPVRNIFENNTASTARNTVVEESAMRYSTLFAKDTAEVRQPSIPKPIVTSTESVSSATRIQDRGTQTVVGSMPSRSFEWGAGRDSLQQQDTFTREQPLESGTNSSTSVAAMQAQANIPQQSSRMSSFMDEMPTTRMQTIAQSPQTEASSVENAAQLPTGQTLDVTVAQSAQQEPIMDEPLRGRNIFDMPVEDEISLPQEHFAKTVEEKEVFENTTDIFTDTIARSERGRQIFDQMPPESLKESLQEDSVASVDSLETSCDKEEILQDISLEEDLYLFDTVQKEEDSFAIDSDEEGIQEKGDEDIFDRPFTMPQEPSNAIVGLQSVVESKQESELSNTIEQDDFNSTQEENGTQYTKKDYLTISPNFLKEEKPEPPKPKKRIHRKYKYPPLELFEDIEEEIVVSEEEKEKNCDIIIETLKGFNISVEIVSITCGPIFTRYDISIPHNITISKVFQYRNELAMRLQSSAGINIQSNYANSSISIEVPNRERTTIGLKEILKDKNYIESCKKTGSLVFSLGKDIEGKVIYGDIAKMKHLLVAGATGTGKSVFLNSLIISLLAKYSPEDLRIILIDPKQVEFSIFSKLPHLMVDEIICDATKVINVLNWTIAEMERRYGLLAEKSKKVHVRNIDEYNAHLTEEEEKLPKIVVIIDEVADLMLQAKKDIEDRIQSLTQKSRAAGIHLVLATQRPSVNVITGVIKGNLPSRVAFKVIQDVDSRTILDCQGAETLLGRGDMLYKLEDMNMPARVQASYLSSEEVQKVVEYIKENNDSYFDESIVEFLKNNNPCESDMSEDSDNIQPVYIEALDIAITSGQVSISMIQRKLSVGYNKAGRIIEWMEHMGYISAFDGAKARRILITREEFEAKYGDYNS